MPSPQNDSSEKCIGQRAYIFGVVERTHSRAVSRNETDTTTFGVRERDIGDGQQGFDDLLVAVTRRLHGIDDFGGHSAARSEHRPRKSGDCVQMRVARFAPFAQCDDVVCRDAHLLACQRVSRETLKALQLPEVQRRFAVDGIETRLMTPEECTSFIAAETARWAPLAKSLAASNPP